MNWKQIDGYKQELDTKTIKSLASTNVLSKNDKTFFKELIKGFHDKIINTDSFKCFESSAIKWIKDIIKKNNKYSTEILELMKIYQESEHWLTSLIGFFYQHGIGCKVDKISALEIYLYIIVNEEKFIYLNTGKTHLFTLNNIIGKYLLSLYYYKDIIIDKKYLLQWNKKYASNGKPLTKDQLGNYYERGIITIENENSAFNLHLNFANKGNPEGQNNLANCYYNGNGVKQDYKKAFEWYLKSAENGNSLGKFNVGYCLDFGIGIDQDKNLAFELYTISAKEGNSYGQNYLGVCYHYGKGVKKDYKLAIEWYLKSANAGNSYGQLNLGYCYEFGIGTIQDKNKAFKCYLKSAQAGNPFGQNNVAECYMDGIGTRIDKIKAFEWYLKSAKGGCAEGQCNLGYCYINGIGITEDYKEAFKWFLKSATAGNLTGQQNLGYVYEKLSGAKCILNSIIENSSEGEYVLGIFFYFGTGTCKNIEEAIKWYSKALKKGCDKAKIELNILLS